MRYFARVLSLLAKAPVVSQQDVAFAGMRASAMVTKSQIDGLLQSRAVRLFSAALIPHAPEAACSLLNVGGSVLHQRGSPCAQPSCACRLCAGSWHLKAPLGNGAQLHSSSSSSISAADMEKEVEQINSMFVEARDEIEYALEEAETVYFDESVTGAKKCVDDCLDKWSALLSQLPEDEAMKLNRSMGLKMEQLRAEFEMLRKTHLEE